MVLVEVVGVEGKVVVGAIGEGVLEELGPKELGHAVKASLPRKSDREGGAVAIAAEGRLPAEEVDEDVPLALGKTPLQKLALAPGPDGPPLGGAEILLNGKDKPMLEGEDVALRWGGDGDKGATARALLVLWRRVGVCWRGRWVWLRVRVWV